MHRVPPERASLRIIDGEAVCHAIEALGDEGVAVDWAGRFALLGDLTRLRLLVCIRAAGPISVSDLVVATGINADTVSQALRHLRAARVVRGARDGKVVRYALADAAIGALLDHVEVSPAPGGLTA